jgi:hypothetical protein
MCDFGSGVVQPGTTAGSPTFGRAKEGYKIAIVNRKKIELGNRYSGRNNRGLGSGLGVYVWLSLAVVFGVPACVIAQSQSPDNAHASMSCGTGTSQAAAAPEKQLPEQRTSGSIRGTVVDRAGTPVAGSRVRLTNGEQSPNQEVQANEDGQFYFSNIVPGPFQLTISSPGFAMQTFAGVLAAGESNVVPQISLAIATEITEVTVQLSTVELAQAQMKDEEKQRVLGLVPNFYVTYVPNAAPLSTRQKFELAWKTTIDPVSFGVTGVIAGVQQSQNDFSGYGQGAQGYAKRYGASYADFVTDTFIGGAIFPALFKQDPRYFYKGTGSKRSRILYAVANSVICKGDNGHWQFDYSAILGGLASGGISNLYYPASDRNGVGLTFENALIGIGANAAANLLQEFLIRKLTPNLPNTAPATATP